MSSEASRPCGRRSTTRSARWRAAAAPAVPALIAAVQQQQRCVDDILEILHNVGKAARPALPLLRTRLNEQLDWDPLMEDEETVRLEALIEELQK